MGRVFTSYVVISPIPVDSATQAWIDQVGVNGGSVGSARRTIVDSLITGLKADGIWTKLDRLLIFAAENELSALTDMVALQLATSVNSATFTTDVGYTGNGTTSYIDSGFSPTAGSPLFQQNSACLFAWNNTSGQSTKPWIAGDNSSSITQINVAETSNNDSWYGVNGGVQPYSDTIGPTGLHLATRTASNLQVKDVNGTQVSSSSGSSLTVVNENLCALRAGTTFGTRQCSCLGFGGALSSTDRTNIYSRLRTYMTAVGVP